MVSEIYHKYETRYEKLYNLYRQSRDDGAQVTDFIDGSSEKSYVISKYNIFYYHLVMHDFGSKLGEIQ